MPMIDSLPVTSTVSISRDVDSTDFFYMGPNLYPVNVDHIQSEIYNRVKRTPLDNLFSYFS